jgi:hypothetical protein
MINLLQRSALNRKDVQPSLNYWLENTREKVFSELARLSDEHKCIVQGEAPNQRVFLPDFFVEKLESIYFSIDGANDKPFPDESAFKVSIPAGFTKEISVATGIINYLEEPQRSVLPILKLVFPEDFGYALALSTHLPKRLLEAAILKLKYIMQLTRTLAFYHQKLVTRFHGQELRVKRFIENITINQAAGIEDIVESNDFSFSAWVFLCPLIIMQAKDIIKRDNSVSPETVALYQSATLLMAFNNYYKIVSLTKRNKIQAFSSISEKMGEPPYMYTFNSLFKLSGVGGARILHNYTENDLTEWLDKETKSYNKNLPHIFKFEIPNDADFFIRKDKLFPLCSYLVKDLQPKVKLEITNRWTRLMADYYKEKAMENDTDFEALITRIAKLYAPALMVILNDHRFEALYNDISQEGAESAKGMVFFSDGKMLPLRKLLDLNRGSLLLYCQLSLPFWHSIPFVVALGRVLKHGVMKSSAYYTESDKQSDVHAPQLKDCVKKIAKEIVPDNIMLDDYMDNIISRWNHYISRQSQEKFTKEVNDVIKNYMQHADSLLKQRVLTHSMLDKIAESIIYSDAALTKITNKNALRLYIKLFITKALMD